MRPYIVKQGDYLASVAHAQGFDAVAVWDHPRNADLKARRPDPNILCPGDVLFVPEGEAKPASLAVGARNDLAAEVPTVRVALALRDDAGEPAKNARYVLRGLGGEQRGTTDGDGRVEFALPVNVREAEIVVEGRRAYRLLFGNLDPIETPTGVVARLTNLGYLEPDEPAASEPDDASGDDDEREAHAAERLRAALGRFQRAADLRVTGQIDDATREALARAHGC